VLEYDEEILFLSEEEITTTTERKREGKRVSALSRRSRGGKYREATPAENKSTANTLGLEYWVCSTPISGGGGTKGYLDLANEN